jgi:hypothetical protein
MVLAFATLCLASSQAVPFPTYDFKANQTIRYTVGVRINEDVTVLSGNLLLKINKPWPSAGWDVDVKLELSADGKGKVESFVSNWIVEKNFKPKALGAGSNMLADSYFKCLFLPTSAKMVDKNEGVEFTRTVEIRKRDDVIEMDSTLESKVQTGLIGQHFDPKLGLIRRSISQLKTNGTTITCELNLVK